MKHLLLLAVLFLSSCLPAMARDLEEGKLSLSTQAGTASRRGSSFQLNLESAISRSFSLGFSYEQGQYANKLYSLIDPEYAVHDYGDNSYLQVGRAPFDNSQSFFLEAAYHFTFIPLKRLDAFAGLGLGMDIESGRSIWKPALSAEGKIVYEKARSYDFAQKLFAGLNYFVTDRLGLGGRFSLHRNPRLGTLAGVTMGATFRLK